MMEKALAILPDREGYDKLKGCSLSCSFLCSFSRHAKTHASKVLVIWLKENVQNPPATGKGVSIRRIGTPPLLYKEQFFF